MYCPRCLKTIPEDRISDITRELKNSLGNTMLEKGKCPVCGTELISAGKPAERHEKGSL